MVQNGSKTFTINIFLQPQTSSGWFPSDKFVPLENILRIFLKYTLEPHCSRNIFTNQPRVAGRMDEDAKVDDSSNGRTHVSRTPKQPEYLIALSRNLLGPGSVGN